MTPLAPLAAFGVVWGWIEQKGLAVDLLKSAIDAVSGRVSGLQGYERRELIAAAHSTIVVAALFESLRDVVGEDFYKRLKITDGEKIAVIGQMTPQARAEGVKYLYTAQIPAPSAACGFEENVIKVGRWQAHYLELVADFIGGLAVVERRGIEWSAVHDGTIKRYRSRYLELAAKVPEFAIWSQLGEHAATRTAVHAVGVETMSGITGLNAMLRERNSDVVAALNANRDALNRVEMLLSAGTRGTDGGETAAAGLIRHQPAGLRVRVGWSNVGILDERIIPADHERYPAGLEIPRVGEIYVNPRYRVATLSEPQRDEPARPADDR